MLDQNITNITANTVMWIRSTKLLKMWIGMMLSLSTVGAALNILLFSAIVSSRKLRAGSGTLIAHSIVIEAVLCAFALPLFTASYWLSLYEVPSAHICRFVFGTFYLFVYAFHWASVPLAANRFVAIFFPRSYGSCVARRPIFGAIIFTWTVSVGCMVLVISDAVSMSRPVPTWKGCGNQAKDRVIFAIFTGVGTSLPAVFEGILYVSLFTLPFLRALFTAPGRTAVVPLFAAQNAGRQRLQVIHSRRVRVTQTVFAAYVWSEMCFMFGPIALTAIGGGLMGMVVIPLLGPALALLGYSTSPVGRLKFVQRIW